jgi:hypothetical protein
MTTPTSPSSGRTSGTFLERSLAVALEHELRRASNVDLGYRTAKCTADVGTADVDEGLI